MDEVNEASERQPLLSSGGASPERALVLSLKGTHREMGRAHAAQVTPLQEPLLSFLRSQWALLRGAPGAGERLHPLWEAWHQHAMPLVQMLEGMAEGLGLEPWALFQYVAAPYVLELAQYPDTGGPDECTVWSAAAWEGGGLQPVLCKNRDTHPQHVHLQVVVLAEPAGGYRYGYISSAGSPGVFSSGINEAGLAVADTRVRTPDQGPGLPRYGLMMEVLEHHDSVASALEYLQSAPHMGGGTLTLADASGHKATVEVAHSGARVVAHVQDLAGWVVSTNHFVHPDLADRWVDPHPPHLRGSSLARRAEVERHLAQRGGALTVADMMALLGLHQGPLDSLCRHEEVDGDSRTVSGTVFLPAQRAFLFCHGYPCRGTFLRFEVGPGAEEGKRESLGWADRRP
ncbi:MAG: C45 family autoproteolytic acyltransferase/hydrolase [Anaerolineae bacterium]